MKSIFTISFTFGLLHLPVYVQSQQSFQPNQCTLNIYIENTNTQLWDQTLVGFNTASTDTFNTQYDANKLMGAGNRETLYTLNGGQKMSINILNSIIANPTVAMGLAPGTDDSFVLSFGDDSTFDNTSYVTLQDIQTNIWHNVKSGNYEFWATANENRNRFMLHFTPPAVITSIDATCDTLGVINVNQLGPAYWNYVLQDKFFNTISTGILNEDAPLTVNVQPGTYTLTLTDTNDYTAVKSIDVGGAPTVQSSFTISTSDVVAQTPVSFTSVAQNAENLNWNFGDGDTASDVTNLTHTYATFGVYTVTLTASNDQGCSASYSKIVKVGATTGISEIGSGNLSVWSYSGSVYVNFAPSAKVDATIKIYDLLGRELSSEKFAGASLYQKEIKTIDEGYVIVNVKNEDQITNRKLFINHSK